MNAEEFKRTLSLMMLDLENLLKHDLKNLSVDPGWSAIDDVVQHVEFLHGQFEGLSNSVKDKKF